MLYLFSWKDIFNMQIVRDLWPSILMYLFAKIYAIKTVVDIKKNSIRKMNDFKIIIIMITIII